MGRGAWRPWRGNPWWIPPFLGRVPGIEPRLVRLLGLVALALFFESYDISMLTSALKFIAEDLGMKEADLGHRLAVIRLGALPALFLVPFADRLGRRRVFLVALVGGSLGTLATAFSNSPDQFVAVQTLTRTFMIAGTAAAVVIVTEEFPAAQRGWAIGMLGALSACGHGLGAALFAAIDVLPGGWRALYVVGLVPLLLLPAFLRGVPETGRFADQVGFHASRHARGSILAGWYRPLANLALAYPARAALLALAAGLFALGDSPVYQFTGYFTQTVHGWSPGQYSAMVIGGGAFGIIGNVVAGRLGDRYGRRPVGLLFLALFPVSAWIFYRGPGWSVPLGFTLFVFCETAAQVVIRALSTELFPTSHRGTSAGWIAFVQTLGWAAGLQLVGFGTLTAADIAPLSTGLSLAALLAGLVLLLLPETRRRELESISPDPAPLARTHT